MRACFRFRVCLFTLFATASAAVLPGNAVAADAKVWQAGFARVAITPAEPMFASGYGSRSKPSKGKIHDLYVRVAAFQDPAGRRLLVVSLDLIGVPKSLADYLTGRIAKRHGIQRADVMLCASHTHCGPALDDKLSHMLALTEKDWAAIRRNQKRLNANILKAVNAAVKDLRPAKLSAGNGRTGFAVNRRKPIGKGPTDHDVPVLRVASADGKSLRGVIFGYACHNTTLRFFQWCGDYAGFAQLDLETRHPGAVAMFFSGCGADQNPLPRRTVELCAKYGRMLSEAVNTVMAGRMTEIERPVATGFRTVDLSFDAIPPKVHWERQLKTGNRYQKARARILLEEIAANGALRKTYPYPVQVWDLGGKITWVALGGEVVVDYSLRLKKELPGTTWVAGYANDVMAYIPSERVLKEGGYEGGRSMLYYQLPTKWKAGLEDRIVNTVKSLVKAGGRSRH
ncbi:MAG: neutral/alkaline non-lysosomal ceramidase N-terminal domain-containing protein [Planctomycetaceae bacterium]